MISGVVIVVVAIALFYAIVKRSGMRVVSPNSVLRRLELPGSEYSIQMTGLTSAWNPAGNSLDLFVMGKGRATYWLDEADLVHLRFQSDSGSERHLTGPKPTYSPQQKLGPIVAVGLLAVTVALIAGGALIGYHTVSPDSGQRGDGAALGAIAAVVTGCALASIARLIVGAHGRNRDRRR